MPIKVVLVTDRYGRYAHVWGEPITWDDFIDQLEEVGCEVIEDQSTEWSDCTKDEIKEDCLSVHQLLNDSDFIPH